MPNMFTEEGKNSKHTHTHTHTDICIHIQKKGERTTSKLKNDKTPHDTHIKKAVSETQNHSNSNTHTQL